jgi:hypothetical protein
LQFDELIDRQAEILPIVAKTIRLRDLADLISAGLLQAGMSLFPRRKKLAHRVGTLLSGGSVNVDGSIFATPSGAAASITGRQTNGWWFFLINQAARRSLRDVLREYVSALAVDIDDDDVENDSDGS